MEEKLNVIELTDEELSKCNGGTRVAYYIGYAFGAALKFVAGAGYAIAKM